MILLFLIAFVTIGFSELALSALDRPGIPRRLERNRHHQKIDWFAAGVVYFATLMYLVAMVWIAQTR